MSTTFVKHVAISGDLIVAHVDILIELHANTIPLIVAAHAIFQHRVDDLTVCNQT